MILFLEDWDKYPRASIDLNTKNESFIRLAKVYKSMGVKNNAFHLSVIDPDLKGIDIYNYGEMEDELIAKIVSECKVNPWYFMREVLRAPPRSGLKNIPVTANRGNIALWWSFLNHVMVFLIQPRQTGKSFNTDGLMVWLLEIRCTDTQINLLTKDDELRRKNIERIKDLMNELPRWLDQRTNKDANNGENITIQKNGNNYNTMVAQASVKAAANLGRGLSTAVFHIDEPPFISHMSTIIPSALPSLTAAQEVAKAAGAPYGVIFTTTAGKKNDPSGKFIYQMLQDAMVWDERKLFDCKNAEELETVVRKYSRADKRQYPNGVFRLNCTFSHRQLGYTDKWLRDTVENAVSTGDDLARDYFNIWTAGTGSSPISTQQAETISMSIKEDPIEEIMTNGYVLRSYVPDLKTWLSNNQCVLGLDTSNASGGDDIGLVILDIATLKVVAAGDYNETNVHKFGKYLCDLAISFPKLTFVIENKSTGTGIIDHMLAILPTEDINPFTRLFSTVVNEKDDSEGNKEAFKTAMSSGRRESTLNHFKKFFGYTTSGYGKYSRENLYGTSFKNAIGYCTDKIFDYKLSNQILSLIIKHGRIDHDDNNKDDMVIAWLLAYWFITGSKNLETYGIKPRQVMSSYMKKEVEDNMTYEEQREFYRQNEIRKKMVDLYAKLEVENDYYISMQLENELRSLNSKLVLRDHEVFSIDQLIHNAREKRKNKRAA